MHWFNLCDKKVNLECVLLKIVLMLSHNTMSMGTSCSSSSPSSRWCVSTSRPLCHLIENQIKCEYLHNADYLANFIHKFAQSKRLKMTHLIIISILYRPVAWPLVCNFLAIDSLLVNPQAINKFHFNAFLAKTLFFSWYLSRPLDDATTSLSKSHYRIGGIAMWCVLFRCLVPEIWTCRDLHKSHQ